MPSPLSIADWIEQGALGTADFLIAAGQSESQVAAALQQQFLGITSGDAGTISEIAFQASRAASELGYRLGFTELSTLNPPINPAGAPGFDTIDVELFWNDPRDDTRHYFRQTLDIVSGGDVNAALAAIAEFEEPLIDRYLLASIGVVPQMQILGLFRGPA